MNDDTTPDPTAPRRRPRALVALAAGSLAGLVLGMGGIASAQEAAPTPAPSATAPAPAEDDAADREPCDEETGSADAATTDEQA